MVYKSFNLNDSCAFLCLNFCLILTYTGFPLAVLTVVSYEIDIFARYFVFKSVLASGSPEFHRSLRWEPILQFTGSPVHVPFFQDTSKIHAFGLHFVFRTKNVCSPYNTLDILSKPRIGNYRIFNFFSLSHACCWILFPELWNLPEIHICAIRWGKARFSF